jgi:putative holliday junction resolvase
VRRIALDIGQARIGVAISQGSLCLPHSRILNNDEAIAQILDLLSDDVVCIYIGLPLSLSGSHTQSTKMAINFASALSKRTDVPLRLIDERLTSKSASQALRQAGKNSREQKGIIDASAAAMILDFAISSERDGLSGKRLEELDA